MKMASNCTSQAEAVIDSGVDSEATTPSSPEDDPHEHEAENQNSRNNKSATLAPSICKSRINSIDEEASPGQQLSDDMVLETAETLLALSGKSKSASNGDTAIVRPRQPPQSTANQGKILAFFSSFTILIFFIPTTTTLAFFQMKLSLSGMPDVIVSFSKRYRYKFLMYQSFCKSLVASFLGVRGSSLLPI